MTALTTNGIPTLDAYRQLVARVQGNVGRLLPAPSPYDASTVPAPVRSLGAMWRQQVVPLLGEVETVFADLGARLGEVLADTTRTADWRSTARTVAVSTATARVQQLGEQIESACDKLLAKAQRLAQPARPTAANAVAQEAQLAGLKSDLQLITSRAGTVEQFVGKLRDRLMAALSADDKLSVWLLTSDWPTEVLAASLQFDRGDLTLICAEWSAAIVELLAAGDPDARAAITAYRGLSDTQGALPALKVATGGFLHGVVNDLADFLARLPQY